MQLASWRELRDIAEKAAAALGSKQSPDAPLAILSHLDALRARRADASPLDTVALECATSGLDWKTASGSLRKASSISPSALLAQISTLQASIGEARGEGERAATETSGRVAWSTFASAVAAACKEANTSALVAHRSVIECATAYADMAKLAALPPECGEAAGSNVFVVVRAFCDEFDKSWAKAKRIAARSTPAVTASAPAPAVAVKPPMPTLATMLTAKFQAAKPADDSDDTDDDQWE